MSMATIEQVVKGIQRYGEEELVAKAQGLRKWALALSIAPISLSAGEMLRDNIDILSKAGYMAEDGMVDVDMIASKAAEIARQTGSVTEHLPLIGDTLFSESDIMALRNCILR